MDRLLQFLTETISIFGFDLQIWVLITGVVVVSWAGILFPGLKK